MIQMKYQTIQVQKRKFQLLKFKIITNVSGVCSSTITQLEPVTLTQTLENKFTLSHISKIFIMNDTVTVKQ